VLIAISPSVTTAVVAMLLVGVGNSLVDVNAITLLQRMTPDQTLGRVFGAIDSLLIGAMALGALITPVLVATASVRATLVVLAAAVTLPVLVAYPSLRGVDARASAPAKSELLRRVSIFAPLPEAIIERLARSLVEMRFGAGSIVLREGAEGDRYYVIEKGTVEVRGVVLGPGDGFGEVALLRDVPRTATVVATTDVVLQVLDRSDFLPAVTGFDESAAAAERVVAQRMSGLKI
jgi:MFS family permease